MAEWAESARSVLVFRTGQLGDTLVSVPAIRAIRAAYPDHRLILLTDRHPGSGFVSSWEIMEATGLFSEVLFYIPPAGMGLGWLKFLRLALHMRRLRPEMIFYLRDFPWNHVGRDRFFFQVLCGIAKSCGLESPQREGFGRRDGTGKLIRFPSEVDRLLGIVGGTGVPIPAPGKAEFTLRIPEKEGGRAEALWREISVPEDALVIGFGPGSKMPAKRWPLERFTRVGRELLAGYPGCRILNFGGPEDDPLGEEMRRVLGDRVANIAGRLSVLESAAALQRCALFVGNDTGVMHLAAAVGTPCVAIFSARDHPGRWEPYGPNHRVLRTEPACSGCLLQACTERDMACLKEIRVEDVVGAVRQILAQTVTG